MMSKRVFPIVLAVFCGVVATIDIIKAKDMDDWAHCPFIYVCMFAFIKWALERD